MTDKKNIKELIYKLHNEKMSGHVIAKKLKLKQTEVYAILHKKIRDDYDARTEKVRVLLTTTKKSIRQIAKEIDRSVETVRNLARNLGITKSK